MKVLRSNLEELAVALGYKTASKWSDDKMVDKFKKEIIPLASEADVPDETNKELLRQVMASEGDIEIVTTVDETEEPAPEEPKPKKEAKKLVKEAKGVDRFGSRIGANTAKINACLTEDPKSVDEVCSESGVENKGVVLGHLRYLEKKGCVELLEGGKVQTKKA